jgi:glutathione S-transferase
VELPPLAKAYVDTIYQWAAFQPWLQAAQAERP